MHPCYPLERISSNNPTMLQSPMARLVPQSVSSINPVGESGLHSDASMYRPLRRLYHPALKQVLIYDKNPDRTVNYYRGPVRKWDSQHTKTLGGATRSRNAQRWEDVVITEFWDGGGSKVSMPVSMLQSLQLFAMTATKIGEHIGWLPLDSSYGRHLIVPLTLTVGGQDYDLNEIREQANIGNTNKTWVDKAVSFSFSLTRPPVLATSLIIGSGV